MFSRCCFALLCLSQDCGEQQDSSCSPRGFWGQTKKCGVLFPSAQIGVLPKEEILGQVLGLKQQHRASSCLGEAANGGKLLIMKPNDGDRVAAGKEKLSDSSTGLDRTFLTQDPVSICGERRQPQIGMGQSRQPLSEHFHHRNLWPSQSANCI